MNFSLVSLCPTSKACCVFSNSNLQARYGRQARAVATACVIWGQGLLGVSLTNNS